MRLDNFSERSGTQSVRQMQGGCTRPRQVLLSDVPFSPKPSIQGTFFVRTSGRCFWPVGLHTGHLLGSWHFLPPPLSVYPVSPCLLFLVMLVSRLNIHMRKMINSAE